MPAVLKSGQDAYGRCIGIIERRVEEALRDVVAAGTGRRNGAAHHDGDTRRDASTRKCRQDSRCRLTFGGEQGILSGADGRRGSHPLVADGGRTPSQG